MLKQQYEPAIPLTVALIILNCFTRVQPASAQLLELATGALSILNSVAGQSNQSNSQQQTPPIAIGQQSIPSSPLSNGKFDVGTDNFSGNTINFCISACFPQGSQPVTQPPVAVPPNSVNSTSPSASNSASTSSTSKQSHSNSSEPNNSQSDRSTNYLPIDFSRL